jgi:hypothetical protein
LILVLLAATAVTACSGGDPAAAAAPDATKGAPSAGGKGPVVLGERFTTRVLYDKGQQNMPAGVVSVPASWQFKYDINWNYANESSPVSSWSSSENPANEEAVYGYPQAQYFTLRPMVQGFMQPGQNSGGLIFAEPVQPVAVLANVIQQVRRGAPNLKFVGSKDLPGLPDSLGVQPDPRMKLQGVGIKVSYDLNGKPVEEEFYAVYYLMQIPYDGPQGRTWQINWGLTRVHSFRAAAGTLDARRPVYAAIARSFRPNPAWIQRCNDVNAYLAAEFNRKLQAGYDQIAAAGALSRQISANSDAMIASIESQRQASNAASPSAAAEARSSNDKFDDYVRGVDTVDDPFYGTSQHDSAQQYHWTDGYGNYRNTNDASADPNRSEVGDWQLMSPTR